MRVFVVQDRTNGKPLGVFTSLEKIEEKFCRDGSPLIVIKQFILSPETTD